MALVTSARSTSETMSKEFCWAMLRVPDVFKYLCREDSIKSPACETCLLVENFIESAELTTKSHELPQIKTWCPCPFLWFRVLVLRSFRQPTKTHQLNSNQG